MSTRTPGLFEVPGSFTVGCNWWASHAGTAMWSDWRPEVVESDFAALAAQGVETVRCFPLWSDFQPVVQLRTFAVNPREIRHGEQPLARPDGVDPVMLERLAWTCACAQRHGLRLLVGLVTGWMSGRFFAPPAIAHLDPITDPESLRWQIRLVKAVVAHLRGQPAVAAWDLGNECNCMGRAPSTHAAALWTATIADAIRAVDPSLPVVSGMHSLMPEPQHSGNWTIQDQAEHCDVLTTHPYPFWCRHTRQDRVDDPRSLHHATAETRLYADVGGRPACAEEIGTMGPMVGDDAAMLGFTRVNAFSLWANDCRGLLWWCAYDQGHLEAAPYDWVAVERELGFFRADRSPRPLLGAFADIAALRRQLPGGLLPPPRPQAVCILSHGQDQWAVAWSAWLLAKQAGFDLRFHWHEQPLPAAACYLLPSLADAQAISGRTWRELCARVEAGADLLITLGEGILSPFAEVVGAAVASRRDRRGEQVAVLADGTRLPLTAGPELAFAPAAGSEVLARSADGAAVAVRARHGRGRIDTWGVPLESQLTATRGGCDPGAPPWRRVYELFCDPLAAGRALARSDAPWLALTEHELGDGARLAVAVNHDHGAVQARLRLAPGWRVAGMLRGAAPAGGVLAVPGQDAAVLRLEQR
jgi:hypothetical protein